MEEKENGNLKKNNTEKKSGLATASLVLSIIGLCTSFIPIINNLSFALALIAIVFSIISLIKKASKKTAIIGIIISIITIIVVVNAQQTLSDSINNTVNEINNGIDEASGSKTEEILANNVDVTIGTFTSNTDSYGIVNTALPVTVKNKSSESKSFEIQIEAVDSAGTRITNDYIYANSLGAGQSQEFKVFEYVEDDLLQSMNNATFKIVEVSMY